MVEQREFETPKYTLDHPDLSIPTGSCKFAISPDGKYVAIGSSNSMLFIFDIRLGEFVEAHSEQHRETIVGVSWGTGGAS